MSSFFKKITAWLIKNAAIVVGIIEGVAKLFAGIVSLTPTKADDALIPIVDKVASTIKKYLYDLSDKLNG